MNYPMQALLTAALLAGSCALGIAQTTQSADRMTSTDSVWVTKVAQGGMAEVELGKLAQSNAANPAVKEFGQRMVEDHTKANEELSSIAAKKGVTVPASLDAKNQALKDRLSKLSGKDFDRAYMTEMVKDHKEDVAEFRKQANSERDPDVKAFAAKTLPTLEEHLKMAQDTYKTLAR